jgi:DNA-directed RNA polymerase specialized sigma24 family protein
MFKASTRYGMRADTFGQCCHPANLVSLLRRPRTDLGDFVGDHLLIAIRGGDLNALVELVRSQAERIIANKGPIYVDDSQSPVTAEELVSDFFVQNKWKIALQASMDDDGLQGYVYTMLNNGLIDKWRNTERGRLRRRLVQILRESDFVESPQGFWRRQQDNGKIYNGSDLPLEEMLWAINIPLVAWRADAQRRSPHADRATFLDLLNAIFGKCQGAIHIDRIVDLIANKVGLQTVSHTEPIDMVDPSLGPDEVAIDAEEDDEGQMLSREIWEQLGPLERRVIPMLDASARVAADALGIGKTSANLAQKRAKEKLRVLLSDSSGSLRGTVIQYLVIKSEHADR